jgi:hypothetical protein
MARNQPTFQSARIPPDVPFDKNVSPSLTQYLRNFSLWCRDGFAEQIRNNQAVPGLLIRSWDTPAGQDPVVFMLRVSEAGVISADQVAVSGNMSTRSIEGRA